MFGGASGSGAAAARNIGIRATRGNYISFKDSDDEWLPHKLERQLAVFEQDRQSDYGLVLCDRIAVSSKGERVIRPRINRMTYEDLLYPAAHTVGTEVFFLKRDLIARELYFDERLPALQDWELLLRISRICRIGYVAEPLVRSYRHEGQPHIHTPENVLKAHFIIRHKYAAELNKRPRALNFSHWQIALNYYHLGQMNNVRLHLKAAIRAYHWYPISYLNYIASLFGRQIFGFFLTARRLASILREMVVTVFSFLIQFLNQRKAKEQ